MPPVVRKKYRVQIDTSTGEEIKEWFPEYISEIHRDGNVRFKLANRIKSFIIIQGICKKILSSGGQNMQ